MELWRPIRRLKTRLGWISHHTDVIDAFPSLYQAQREAGRLCSACIYFSRGVNTHDEILGICNISAKVNYRISEVAAALPHPKHGAAAQQNRLSGGVKGQPAKISEATGTAAVSEPTFPLRRF